MVTEQEIRRVSDENKTMIHRLSSFQPSELSGFEGRTLNSLYKISHNSVFNFFIPKDCNSVRRSIKKEIR